MTVELRYYTDPACEWSWATEPQLRRLIWEFGDSISPRWVMGGLARTLDRDDHATHLAGWLEAAAAAGMPCDPRLWLINPISSTYPACQAVLAAREQAAEAGCTRVAGAAGAGAHRRSVGGGIGEVEASLGVASKHWGACLGSTSMPQAAVRSRIAVEPA